VQTVSENDKDPPIVVVDEPATIGEYWARVLNVKNAAGQKTIALWAKWCEQASHYRTETQMLNDAFPYTRKL